MNTMKLTYLFFAWRLITNVSLLGGVCCIQNVSLVYLIVCLFDVVMFGRPVPSYDVTVFVHAPMKPIHVSEFVFNLLYELHVEVPDVAEILVTHILLVYRVGLQVFNGNSLLIERVTNGLIAKVFSHRRQISASVVEVCTSKAIL
jgi:hypothetical protein